VLLRPGQQAAIAEKKIAVNAVDTDEYTAWLNNEFSFENKNIEAIMKTISRWYDVDVSYQGNRYDNRKFGGTYTRTKGLSALLKHLESLSGIHFIVEGRRIKVLI
jgi:ferric-dicitrate binding protein FerR (iron transport regulator)